jgi:hypothetical protein
MTPPVNHSSRARWQQETIIDHHGQFRNVLAHVVPTGDEQDTDASLEEGELVDNSMPPAMAELQPRRVVRSPTRPAPTVPPRSTSNPHISAGARSLPRRRSRSREVRRNSLERFDRPPPPYSPGQWSPLPANWHTDMSDGETSTIRNHLTGATSYPPLVPSAGLPWVGAGANVALEACRPALASLDVASPFAAPPRARLTEEVHLSSRLRSEAQFHHRNRHDPNSENWLWRKYSELTLRSMQVRAPWMMHMPVISQLVWKMEGAQSVERLINLSTELLCRATELNTQLVSWYTAAHTQDLQLMCATASASQWQNILEIGQQRLETTQRTYGYGQPPPTQHEQRVTFLDRSQPVRFN